MKDKRVIDTPAFLDMNRPSEIPNLVVPQGIAPFYLSQSPVRGRLIRLGPLADALLSRHDLPPEVTTLCGQALALVAAMASALKFHGSFSLQIKGDGPVSLLVADCTDMGALRFTARMAERDEARPLPDRAKALLGDGYLAFTVDQGPETDRHQGIVSLTGETLSDMAMHYFQSSEQHECWIRLFCDETDDGWRAGALVLEKIAGEGGTAAAQDDAFEEDRWQTACTFAETLTEAEMFDPALGNTALIERLFKTLGVCASPARALAFGCRCTRARLINVLKRFSQEDLDHMTEEGSISMECGFCNIGFLFDREELHNECPDD